MQTGVGLYFDGYTMQTIMCYIPLKGPGVEGK